jgi:phosphoenolpyruvate carboxykinase (GTP)
LKWVIDRCYARVGFEETAIGWIPRREELDMNGLNIPECDLRELLAVRASEWQEELQDIKQHYAQFGDKMPQGLLDELVELEQLLGQGACQV